MSSDEYKLDVQDTFNRIKTAPVGLEATMPVALCGRRVARLEPVTWGDLNSADSIALLAEWRAAASHAFPAVFPVTHDGTQRWLQKGVLEATDRLLFWLVTNGRERIGHLGLFRFDYEQRTVEIDNIVAGGVPGALPGVMQSAVSTLITWTFDEFQVTDVLLKVFSDNDRAVRLYQRLGFKECGRTPLKKEVDGPVTRWVDAAPGSPHDRHYVTMRLPRTRWEQAHRKAA